jgi:predicted dehydrogenase
MKSTRASSAPTPTRRQFLARTGRAALAGLTLPQLLPAGVLAADGRPGANDRIGIGFIGIGRQASALLSAALRRPATRVVAFADANLPRAQAAATKHQAEAGQDYRRLLERKDVDAIFTATPDHWRSLVCIHACQAGKDVYGEKPMTLTIREGRLMVQAARKHQRVFQTGSQQRSMRENIIGCDLVRKGAIGKITKVFAQNYPSPWECALPAQAVPDGIDWNLWCGPGPLVPFHTDIYNPRANPGWISFRPWSGGEVTGWGAHGFDQIQSALGMDESGPVELWTDGEKFTPPSFTAPESRDRAEKLCCVPKVFFRYATGTVVEMTGEPAGGGVLGGGISGGGIFVGEKGKIRIDRGICRSEPDEELAENAVRAGRDQGGDHIQNWYDCIKSRQRPRADVETGHRSATVCHLVNIARWTGRRLQWDPVKEEFVGDKEANTFLDRERRKGFELPAVA